MIVQSFPSVFTDICRKWPSEQFWWASVLGGFQICLYAGREAKLKQKCYFQEQQKSLSSFPYLQLVVVQVGAPATAVDLGIYKKNTPQLQKTKGLLW